MAASKQKRLYFTVGCLLCLIYTFHVSFRSFIHLDTITCDSSVSQNKQLGLVLRPEKNSNTSKLDRKLEISKVTSLLSSLNRTDYFGCEDFEKLPVTVQSRPENAVGNRGISFIKVRINGITIPAVYKEANRILKLYSEQYKYSMAIREIEYLEKLQGLPGIPRIFGSCIKVSSVTYLVERIEGSTFCDDNGTTPNCSNANYLMKAIKQSVDPRLSALKLTYSTATLFRLLEERHLFFEDISGVNLMFTPEFDVYLIDADSLVFYNETRLFSKLSCDQSADCSGPVGNLWVPRSLNARIYSKCRDIAGMCENERCRGFDVALHACGLAHWFICKLATLFEDLPELKYICGCMNQEYPQNRCSFASVEEKMKLILRKYQG